MSHSRQASQSRWVAAGLTRVGPEDQINIRILRSGHKAQDREASKNPELWWDPYLHVACWALMYVPVLCVCTLLLEMMRQSHRLIEGWVGFGMEMTFVQVLGGGGGSRGMDPQHLCQALRNFGVKKY